MGTVASQGGSQVFAYDAARNQMIVGQPASNRVILHRTGVATSLIITGDTPDPSMQGQLASFTATMTASPAPGNGMVSFRASTGESCTDITPAVVNASTVTWSCNIAFQAIGSALVTAEYTGSFAHAYSRSGAEGHTVTPELALFANGFE